MPNPHVPQSWQINQSRVLHALRDAVKHTPGISRYTAFQRTIHPMGVSYAAEVTGRSVNYIECALNPTDDTHNLQLPDFLMMLQAGLDCSVMDEMERVIGRVGVGVPQVNPTDDDVHRRMLKIGEAMGHICRQLVVAFEGDTINTRLALALDRDTHALIGMIWELRDSIRYQRAECR